MKNSGTDRIRRQINLYVYDVKKDEITIGESYDVEAGDDVFIRTKYDNEQIDMLIFKQ